jgi:hypothetical protein
MTSTVRRLSVVVAGVIGMVILAGCGGSPGLVGTFRIDPGRCGGAAITGSYFRIAKPGGSIASGPFFLNPQSTCRDRSYTVVQPGSDGGLVAGSFQPNPQPAFDSAGHPRAGAIIAPVAFDGSSLSISTNSVDPQSGEHLSPPAIKAVKGKLSGQLEAWSGEWSRQYFNQGSPRPDGGLTRPATGNYDRTTGAYVLTWASQMLGYPFNGFTVYWHLAGRFIAGK